jgi:hypothetical protein
VKQRQVRTKRFILVVPAEQEYVVAPDDEVALTIPTRTPSLAPRQQRSRIDGASDKTESKDQYCGDTKRARLVEFNHVGTTWEQNLANTPNTMMQDATNSYSQLDTFLKCQRDRCSLVSTCLTRRETGLGKLSFRCSSSQEIILSDASNWCEMLHPSGSCPSPSYST